MKRLIFCFWALALCLGLAGQTEISRETILRHPGWMTEYETHHPDREIIGHLRAGTFAEVHIDVYFAFWCVDSKINLPRFIKLLDILDMPVVPVKFYLVERKATPGTSTYVESLHVTKIPTFIVYRNGSEIGRIVEYPKKDLARDFLEILR